MTQKKTPNNPNKREESVAAEGRGVRVRFFALLAAAVLLTAGFLLIGIERDAMASDAPAKAEAITAESVPVKEDPVTLTFVCVGDVMVHRSQIDSQYDAESGTYDYRNNFQYVSDYIKAADLSLCNVETTFAGGTPSGYPSFNAPDALADALSDAGFDVAMTSNNHLFDKGLEAVKRTLTVLRAAGLETSGTRLPDEPRYTLIEVEGVKVAVVSYTYETPSSGGRPTINSSALSEDAEALINSFSYDTLSEDLLEIGDTVAKARDAGAQIVICYYHWGQEYQREPDQWQMTMAEQSADLGADLVFASHPHVLQRIEMVTGSASGKTIPVFYSMGNFLSNQRTETLENRYTEQGMMARVTLTYDPNDNRILTQSADAMGTWVDKYESGGKLVYAIVPLDENMENNAALRDSGHLARAKQALADIEALLGSEMLWQSK